MARLLGAAGASVGIGYRSRDADAEAVVAELQERGVRAWAQAGDLSLVTDAEALFQRAYEEFGGLDIFVGNAGVWPPEDVALQDMTEERWRRTLTVNLDGVFFATRAAARLLRNEGRIVLVSSTAGQRGEAFHGDYAASKGALLSLVKGLCVEVAPRGITVNAVAPGWIETEMAEPAFGAGGRERIAESIPLRRIATADDVAGPIVFLCSRLARHITGEILNVNGGAVLVG